MKLFKAPMLAASLLKPNVPHTNKEILKAMQKLRMPVMATIKKDGIRAERMNKTLLSRTLKTIPNKSICDRAKYLPGGFDMELFNPELEYNQIESIVMSREHKDSNLIQFHVLDWYGIEGGYGYRMNCILKVSQNLDFEFDYPLTCTTPESLLATFLQFESLGAEGICFRAPNSPYKCGRSTLKEQYLVKLSRYERTELIIVAFEEQMENTNPNKRNEVGLMKRSSYGEGMIGKNTLGAFICSTIDLFDASISDAVMTEFVNVGTGVGLTDKLRKEIWDNQDKYLGEVITVKHKNHGMKDKLRHPIFCGFRKDGQ